MFYTKAWRNIFWAGFTFDPPKIYFSLCPSFLFSLFFFSFFLLPGTIPDNSPSKNPEIPVFQFTTMCPPITGLIRTEGVRHKWRRDHTHSPTFHSQRATFSNLCRDPAFLSGAVCSFIQGKGERSLGRATLIALGNLPVMQGQGGKPRKKK